jgi:hypothetical protein
MNDSPPVPPCIVCGKVLTSAFPGDDGDQSYNPSGACIFMSGGNYGSRVFDSFSWENRGSRLWVDICDDCLKNASAQGRVHLVSQPDVPPPPYDREVWDEEEYNSPGY